jgi:hypothetical protein
LRVVPESFERLKSTDLFYDIYKKFWGEPLSLEQLSVISTDEDGMPVKNSFNVLKIDSRVVPETKGKMIVRKEYLDAVANLEKRFASFPNTGAIVLGHPGIGVCYIVNFTLLASMPSR